MVRDGEKQIDHALGKGWVAADEAGKRAELHPESIQWVFTRGRIPCSEKHIYDGIGCVRSTQPSCKITAEEVAYGNHELVLVVALGFFPTHPLVYC